MYFSLDINECDTSLSPSGKCGANAICSNSPGGFSCSCKPGFTGDPFVNCYDVDECLDRTACGREGVCENLPGSFTCSCPNGSPFQDGLKSCTSELTCDSSDNCPGNAICQNGGCNCPEPNVGPNCEGERFCFIVLVLQTIMVKIV